MNDRASENAVEARLGELERRVESLETKASSVPPPVDPSAPPSLSDLELPIPSAKAIVAGAKSTWTMLEMFGELRLLFWTLLDRRYHMAWITRLATIVLLAMILTSQWWEPLAKVDYIGPFLDKITNLLLGLILFVFLSFEVRRYKEWRSSQ